jgi:UrcA family protein
MIRNLMIAALAANCFVVPAAAQVRPAIATIKLADLDLSRRRDVRRLDLRIARAAADLCRPESALDPVGGIAGGRCTRETIDAAKIQRDRIVAKFASRAELSSR